MAGIANTHSITIDLNQFKLSITVKNRIELTLHFNSPSRRFYLCVIALIVSEMKRQSKVTSIPLQGRHELLALLNETIGGSAGSSETEPLLSRIYSKWQHALPNLEEAPLFTVLGRKKGYEDGVGKTYLFTEAEKDCWANLFEYKGSHENVRLKFAIDKIGAALDEVLIVYEELSDGDAWMKFISGLRREGEPRKPVSKEAEVLGPPLKPRKRSFPLKYRWPALVALIILVLGAITLAIRKPYQKPDPADVASKEKMAFPLPDVPSIAVMPFTNMTGDSKQDFLTDGITENIITGLSKISRLFVISRQSTFFYKGKPVKVKQIAEELGVQYVLEGSVQRSTSRIRINAQLIDTLTGRHLWAERYEGDETDLFALQDQITMKILTATQVKLTGWELSSGYSKYFKGKAGFECYLKLMEAAKYREAQNVADTNVARRLAEETSSICPENPVAYCELAGAYVNDYLFDNTKPPRETLDKAEEMAKRAIAIDDSLPVAHIALANVYFYKREYVKAIAEGERATVLDPGGSTGYQIYGGALLFACRPNEAIAMFEKTIRLNPNAMGQAFRGFGAALRRGGRFDESVSAYKKAIERTPNDIGAHIGLAATYVLMGRDEEAHAEAEEVLRINPKFSLSHYAKVFAYKDKSETDKLTDALRKVGLK